ncbi:MAG TPA: molybdopterin-guanine dinucleotide biosynthesis protein B [Gemmatimonadaceae bacterium]|nr:molybdopterin-guanine dinucleotide biosynthesis protein B [Gemmatimonadaceae bacterium]
MTPPIVTVVGRKHSGKTTLVVRLAAELHRRGHRVMTIKHGAHTFNIDPKTTDTYRHYHEGNAERVVMAAPDKFALVQRWSEELGPREIAERYLSDADIVLCEGFKKSDLPRIEVFRRAAHDEPLYDAEAPNAQHYLALVTDDLDVVSKPPVFDIAAPDLLPQLAALIEQRVMRRVGAAS